jgi:hypothetical protein
VIFVLALADLTIAKEVSFVQTDILEPFGKRLSRYFVPRASGYFEHMDCVLATCRDQLHCPESHTLLVIHRKREAFRHRSRNNSGNFVHAAFQLLGR